MNKTQLFSKWNNQINVYNELLEALAIVDSVAKEFDGKVLNKRFTNKVDNKFVVDGMHTRLDFNYATKPQLVITYYGTYPFYTADLYNHMILTDYSLSMADNNNRLVYANFEIIKNKVEGQYRKMVNDYKLAMKNFDAYMQRVNSLNEQIRQLEKDGVFPLKIKYGQELKMFWE